MYMYILHRQERPASCERLIMIKDEMNKPTQVYSMLNSIYTYHTDLTSSQSVRL